VEEGAGLAGVGEGCAGERLVRGELLPGVEDLAGLDEDLLAEGGGFSTITAGSWRSARSARAAAMKSRS
jgi:hypothetical protein